MLQLRENVLNQEDQISYKKGKMLLLFCCD